MINKTYSKHDLVHIINSLNLPVVFNHSDNKKTIQEKIINYYHDDTDDSFKSDNVYDIKNKKDLFIYLEKSNPKKIINVKQKNDIMNICKMIIRYCNNKYDINYTTYKTSQDIIDDLNYIRQYGDIPSVRRCCNLINNCPNIKETFKPLISPQVKQQLLEKNISKKTIMNCLTIKRGKFILEFEH
jgi:hypothetical protein